MITLRPYMKSTLALGFLLLPLTAHAQFVSSISSKWTPIKYGGNGVNDPSVDQQTGQRESDIVGTSTIPSAYMAFISNTPSNLTDGEMFFRIRMSTDTQAAGYNGYMWVGIDANADGKVDLFVGANKQGSTSENVIRNPGTGTNTSPNTTSISNTNISGAPFTHTNGNYNWSTVTAANYAGTNFDVDTNGTDYFMSFSLPFQNIVNALNTTGTGRPSAISINQNTALSFVIASSQQGNSINQDYNGGNIAVNSTSTFSTLGIISDATAPSSFQVAIPEPASLALLLPGLLLLRRRRK